MAYTKTTWVNDSAPAINATNLNKIEQGIYDAHEGLDDKVDAVTGKGLSTNDFTDADETKLNGIEAGAEVNTIETVKVDGSALTPDANKAVDIDLSGKQDTLVSGTNIKTINNNSLLGSGNITIEGGGGGGGGDTVTYTQTVSSGTELGSININGNANKVYAPTIPSNVSSFNNDAGYLTSHQSIKTINSTSLVGTGNVAVQATLVSGTNIKTVNSTSLLGSGDVAVQPTLVSGTNIKTINSTSLLGSGNISISSGASMSQTTASLTSSGWSNSSKTVNVTGVTSSNAVIVSPATASRDDYISCGIWCSAQGSGTLTFTCESTPSSTLTVNVLILT